MIVTGWNNGSPNNKTGAGYGIRLKIKDRNKYFKPSWKEVIIEFDDALPTEVKLTTSFWKTCIELRKNYIGKWLLRNGLAPWPENQPPKCVLKYLNENRFKLTKS